MVSAGSRPDQSRRILLLDSEISSFGRHEHRSAIDCAAASVSVLLGRNAEIVDRIQLIVAGAARVAPSEGINSGLAQLIGERVGLPRAPGVEVHAFCASSNAALRTAVDALLAGRADAAVVVGLEHSLASASGPLVPDAAQVEGEHGFAPPVFYALCARRYLHETDAPVDALAQVAVKNRGFAATNPRARFRDPLTVEQVLESRMIAEPLTLLQCCPPADGAGGLLLAADDVLDAAPAGAVEILGLGSASADPDTTTLTSFAEDVESGRAAFNAAGIGPDDVDVAEVHDAFTISQVLHLEDLGLARRGEGWRHALDDAPRLVVNPSGGLLSRGHPLGATGVAQFDSVRRYLAADTVDERRRRFGLVQEAGGLRPLGQILSEVAVLGRVGA